MIDARRGMLAVAMALCLGAHVGAEEIAAPLSMQDMMALDASGAQRIAQAGAARLREEIVRDAALVLGTQGGYSERAAEIIAIVDRQASNLDKIFNFSPLCREGRVLAPVVELVEDVLAVEVDGSAMRETARVLRVTKPARLVTTPPTWRDWLRIRPAPPSDPDVVAFPTTKREREVWQAAISESWAVGRRHADSVYLAEVEMLKHDYEGMLRYHELLAQGIVAPAEVGRSDLGIVREDAELRIGDTIFQVSAPARFERAERWKPVVKVHASRESAE